MLKAAIMFQDHMILQREKPVAVWGTCRPGQTVTVSVQGQTASGCADADGHWAVTVGPLRASFSETLTVAGDGEELFFKDVQVGDVYLAAGQSNMEFFMRYDADYTEELSACENENIRLFDYPEVSYPDQLGEADYLKNFGFWRKACPENLEWFPAVAYYFAKDIQKKYQIPVGILGCNWGGTPACAWMSEESILEGGGKAWLDDYRESLRTLDPVAYEEQIRRNPMTWRTNPLEDIFSDMLMRGASILDVIRAITGQEPDLSMMDSAAAAPAIGPKSETRPSGLYESMLSVVAPYTLRGFLFYQGESDGDRYPEVYATLFPALIRGFRALWKEELPFLFVQLAPFGSWMASTGEPYVQVRKAQQLASETVVGTGMAVITDIGMELDIHPKKKQPVGHRLALQAMHRVYGDTDVLCEAPTLIAGELKDGELVLTFANTGEGLYLASETPDHAAADPEKLGGLQITQSGSPLAMENVSARAAEDKVILTSSELKAGASLTVALARTGWYRVNLYNSADIPARPAELTV